MAGSLQAEGVVATISQVPARQSPRSKTVWDGVYTAAQSERGEQAYKRDCGYCHRDDLSGGGSEDGAPPLNGFTFSSRWRDLSLGDLYGTIKSTMPRDAPGSLAPQAYVDIISFLLKANEIPAGAVELGDPLDLDEIVVTERVR